jgi:hypothetical protein
MLSLESILITAWLAVTCYAVFGRQIAIKNKNPDPAPQLRNPISKAQKDFPFDPYQATFPAFNQRFVKDQTRINEKTTVVNMPGYKEGYRERWRKTVIQRKDWKLDPIVQHYAKPAISTNWFPPAMNTNTLQTPRGPGYIGPEHYYKEDILGNWANVLSLFTWMPRRYSLKGEPKTGTCS